MNQLIFITDDMNLSEVLPRSLLVLHAHLAILDVPVSVLTAGLPPHIHAMGSITVSEITDDLLLLPSTLVDATISVTSSFTWTLDVSKCIPPLINRLWLDNIELSTFQGTDWVLTLPNNLTALGLSVDGPPNVFGSNIALLPASLSILDVDRCPKPLFEWDKIASVIAQRRDASGPNASFWPSSLTQIRFSDMEPLRQCQLALLPQSLTSLYCTVIPSISRLGPTHIFPPNLTHLKITVQGSPHDEDEGAVPPFLLPPQLLSLDFDQWRFSVPTAYIPRSVTDLRLHGPYVDDDDVTSNIISELPPGLKRLMLSFERRVPRRRSVLRRGQAPRLLPAKYTPSYIPTLPLPLNCSSILSQLTTLCIMHLGVPTTILRHLPRTMKELVVEFDSAYFRVDDLCFLPPHLTKFDHQSSLNAHINYIGQYWPIRCPIPSTANSSTLAQIHHRIGQLVNGDI